MVPRTSASVPILYGPDGVQIPIPGPERPSLTIQPGTTHTHRDRWREYPSENLKPSRVGAIMKEADSGDPYRLILLAEEMEEKDPKVASILQTRRAAVGGLEWEVRAPQLDEARKGEQKLADEIARFCYRTLEAANFGDLVDTLQEAVYLPHAVSKIFWGEDPDGKWVPVEFARVPPTHVRWGMLQDVIYLYDPNDTKVDANGDRGAVVEPYTTVRMLSPAQRGHPSRGGLCRTVAWYYLFKNLSMKDLMAYVDKFGMPPRVLKIPRSDFEAQEIFDLYREQLMNLGTEGSAVVSDNTTIEFGPHGDKAGAELYGFVMDYFDKSLAWVVLGHELSSQSAPGSGVQNGVTPAKEVRQDILELDCKRNARAVKRDVLTPTVGFNFGWDVVQRGLVPNLWFDYQPAPDLAMMSSTMERVRRTFPKMKFSMQQVRELYGYDEPLNEEDTLGGEEPVDEIDHETGLPIEEEPDPGEKKEKDELVMARRAKSTPKAKQVPVDVLGARAVAAAKKTTDEWAAELRELLRALAEDGSVTLAQARAEVIKKWPALDVAGLTETLQHQLVLARLYGRNDGEAKE